MMKKLLSGTLIAMLVIMSTTACTKSSSTITEPAGGSVVIMVTTDSDALNGKIANIESLIADPGPDGISLREAIEAANRFRQPVTIEFSPHLKGTHIMVGSGKRGTLPILTGGWLTIDGDVDRDGKSDITLDGSIFKTSSTGITIDSSHNTITGLTLVGFSHSGIKLTARKNDVISDNKILRNVVYGGRYFGIGTAPTESQRDKLWEDTVIAENEIIDAIETGIRLLAGRSHAVNNRIQNTVITGNKVTGGSNGIMVFAGDGSWSFLEFWRQYADGNIVDNTTISNNTIEDTKNSGIVITGANFGNRDNEVSDVKITGNIIRATGEGVKIDAAHSNWSRSTSGNIVHDVVIEGNNITEVNYGVFLSGGGSPGQEVHRLGAEVSGNELRAITVVRNSVMNYSTAAFIVCGGVGAARGASNNIVTQLQISENQAIASPKHKVLAGIKLVGGIEDKALPGPAYGNRLQEVIISGNTISGNSIGIFLVGGEGSGARDNYVAIVELGNNSLESNGKAVSTTKDSNGAANNGVASPSLVPQ